MAHKEMNLARVPPPPSQHMEIHHLEHPQPRHAPNTLDVCGPSS